MKQLFKVILPAIFVTILFHFGIYEGKDVEHKKADIQAAQLQVLLHRNAQDNLEECTTAQLTNDWGRCLKFLELTEKEWRH
jgi:hypothetical protein